MLGTGRAPPGSAANPVFSQVFGRVLFGALSVAVRGWKGCWGSFPVAGIVILGVVAWLRHRGEPHLDRISGNL